MASISATATGVTATRRRFAPPALSESLVNSYQTPSESFPDTPEPWSTMAAGAAPYGVVGGASAAASSQEVVPEVTVTVSSPDFGLSQPAGQAAREKAQASGRPTGGSQLSLTVPGMAAAFAAKAKSSKLLTVRNTFIDVGLPSPMEQLRQAHSCPGSRMVTPQSCRSGRMLMSPLLDDASVESSAVSTVDTEEAAQPHGLPLSCFEQSLESPPAPASAAFGVHRLRAYDLPQQHVYDPALYDASASHQASYSHEQLPPVMSQQAAYHPAPVSYETPQRLYEMPPQPFHQQQQTGTFQWSEAQYENTAPPQLQHHQQQPHHASGTMGTMPWGSEPLPTLLTAAHGQAAQAPSKPILQLDKVLPVSYPGAGAALEAAAPAAPVRGALGSAEMPTLGSAGHGTSECKPCAFYWKPQGCGNGVNCVFCHLCDSGEKKRRAKEKRVAMRMAKATGVYM